MAISTDFELWLVGVFFATTLSPELLWLCLGAFLRPSLDSDGAALLQAGKDLLDMAIYAPIMADGGFPSERWPLCPLSCFPPLFLR
jgi:hypothetical protein